MPLLLRLTDRHTIARVFVAKHHRASSTSPPESRPAKKFRYTLELFAEFYSPAAAHWITQVKELQSLLGAMDDCRSVRHLVDALGGNPKIEASLKKRQRRKSLEFRRAWTAHCGAPDCAKQ